MDTSSSSNELLITANSQGIILVDGKKNDKLAKKLNVLKAYLSEIFFQNKVGQPRKTAARIILNAEIKDSWITIETPAEIRVEFPEEKKWKIPADGVQMKIFYLEKIYR